MSDGFAATAGEAARPAPWRLRRTLDACLLLALVIYLGLTVATFFARHSWLADLVTHFRPQLLLAAAALAAVMAAAGRPRWVVPLLLAAAVHAAVLLWPAPRPAASVAGPGLRITSYNLFFESTEYEPALAYLRARQPDILILAEASIPWQGRLERLAGQLPYSTLDRPGGRSWDLVVMSRHPVRSFKAEAPTGRAGRPLGLNALRLVIEVAGRPLVLWAVHPPSPMSAANWQTRNDYLGWVAARVAAEDPSMPVIVAGDFNQTPWTPWHRAFLERSGLVDAAGTSWPEATRRPFGGLPWSLLATPIDRVLVRPGIGVTGFDVGPQFGSDHNPVTADLVMAPPPR